MGYHEPLFTCNGEPEPESQDDFLAAQNKGRQIMVEQSSEVERVNFVFDQVRGVYE